MENIKRRQSRGPRSLVSMLAKALIKKAELTDKEICEKIKERYPEASTSVKCIQYYRYQMRTDGEIPPAKVNRRKEQIILMWELIPGVTAIPQENLEGQYTGKALIKRCREVMQKTYNVSKKQAWEELYSVPSCALFLREIGWDCVEFQTTRKINEYVED